METKSCVVLRNGGEIKLPVGFRFRPTDEELLLHYLKRKVLSASLPALFIPELDVFETDPWSLPGDLRERRHFFCRRTALKGSSSLHRKCNGAATRDGSSYWKLTGKEKKIVASGNNRVIGMRRKLAFYRGKDFDSAAPQWIMHELRLLSTRTDASDFTCFGDDMTPPELGRRGGEWAVYRVFQRRRKQPNIRSGDGIVTLPQVVITATPTVIDFRNEAEDMMVMAVGPESNLFPSPPPSPCSSSSTHGQGQEMSIAFHGFSS